MCGIAGIYNYADVDRPVDRELLTRMTRALAHRGPDGEGIHVDGPIGLGHRRLAIVDLSPTGAQPMEAEGAWIAYNGELYNHRALRAELKHKTFRGSSDTETLLRLMLEQGPDSLARADGIFGFAFWQPRDRTLTLARDPLGVKQVYYFDDGRRLLFASEIKALFACADVPRQVDVEGLNQYLHFHTPLFERTFFRGVRVLKQGEYLVVSPTSRRSKTYWRVEDFAPRAAPLEQQVEELRGKLATVVSDQLMADVPVGAFFSGGIDSSAVASYASKAGARPQCFGVHFSDQGVIDERPFQEAAAKALGLELNLITLDGSSFPEDLSRLMYHQDQPVIGPAFLPMAAVSKLASQRVKVCLGGQAADELFGGYARYALARPDLVAKGWVQGRLARFRERRSAPPSAPATPRNRQVGGNLWAQLTERKTLHRLLRNARNLADWRALYFENFAKIPESVWHDAFGQRGIVSRESCWDVYTSTLEKTPAADPSTRLMHWDFQTYLPGLFQQDDRMSMASSLESRVPLADPRLVQFAFQSSMDVKLRDGATKWILRQAVSDVIPHEVLTRRKVGFDTPVERWMRTLHAPFVRDLLLSRQARERGLWDPRFLQRLLDQPDSVPFSLDVLWKTVCIEVWAQKFLDRNPVLDTLAATPPPQTHQLRDRNDPGEAGTRLQHALQEVRELGVRGTAFRARWELQQRAGLTRILEPRGEPPPNLPSIQPLTAFARGAEIESAVRSVVPRKNLERLRELALRASEGKILAFGRWWADYGNPIDWQRNPVNGRRWNPKLHWSKALTDERSVGDVKLTWEVARFPQAYWFARAASFFPELRVPLATAFAEQVTQFIRANRPRKGVHWNSGQEVVLRSMSWLFGHAELYDTAAVAQLNRELSRYLYLGFEHVERHRVYAEKAVSNNHLLSESLGAFIPSVLWPHDPDASRWRQEGMSLLTREADRQFYADGGYMQQSHNYERVAMLTYLWAMRVAQSAGVAVPSEWGRAVERGLDFLYDQQSAVDGSVPNFGPMDGTLPIQMSTTDFVDFRPALQLASAMTRGERLYEPGPWDEPALWHLGPKALELPLRKRARRSRSASIYGHHTLRGHEEGTFSTLRCGTLIDRFSQIDMLHMDVYWRGHNVLVDGGTYLYNDDQSWHHHFLGTASHNTVTVDGRDQMLHYRRFKNLYWTEAKLLRFEDQPEWALAEGEHYGYRRHPGHAVHRRSVVFAKDGLWVVVDRVEGEGEHDVRLQWLLADYPFRYTASDSALSLNTPAGDLSVLVLDSAGAPLPADVVRGRGYPHRGWLSRYYGERTQRLLWRAKNAPFFPLRW